MQEITRFFGAYCTRRFPYGLHYQGDGAAGFVGIGNSERDPLTALVAYDYYKMPRAA
jgi:hypothetical protein